MKILYIYILFLLYSYSKCENNNDSSKKDSINLTGRFWQITDIHWDLEYSETGDKTKMCHESSQNSKESTGHYGNYLCDSPYILVQSALHAMKGIEAGPDFILWTGDNAPHTDDVNFPVIFKTLQNITEEISSLFGSEVPLIPVLGNHDSFPQDDYPASGDAFYTRYLEEGNWKKVLPEPCYEDFKRGGYYKREISSNFIILVLNTNLYYRYNELGKRLEDPGGQFAWMRENLQKAKDTKKKVFVAAHAPPGYWERNPMAPFFNDSYNDKYVDILNEFGTEIIGQFYGHEHTDSFRIFQEKQDDYRSVAFLAPSVTPWYPTRMEGGTAINPSVRLYTYSSTSIVDYIQYHLNLTEANGSNISESCRPTSKNDSVVLKQCEETSRAIWRNYYQATKAFRVEALDVNEMVKVFNELSTNDSFFQEYFLRNSAGIEHGYCNDSCKRNHICVISNQKVDTVLTCLKGSHNMKLPFGNEIVDDSQPVVIAVGAFLLSVICGGLITLIIIRLRKQPYSRTLSRDGGYSPLNVEEED